MSVLGDRIKQTRISKEWTQEELSKKIGTSKNVISNWERGRANPDPKQIIAIANAFEVSSDYLLGLSNYQEPHFRDPFGQITTVPTIDYSFINETTWDLPKLINSGIVLTVGDFQISANDKLMLTTIIEAAIKRIKELPYEVNEEALESIKKDQESPLR